MSCFKYFPTNFFSVFKILLFASFFWRWDWGFFPCSICLTRVRCVWVCTYLMCSPRPHAYATHQTHAHPQANSTVGVVCFGVWTHYLWHNHKAMNCKTNIIYKFFATKNILWPTLYDCHSLKRFDTCRCPHVSEPAVNYMPCKH